MLTYILQTIAFQLIFLLVYELFLKKETFFTYNRVYLLLTPVLALLLPLLKIPFLQTVVPAETYVMLPEVFIGGSNPAGKTVNVEQVTSEAAQTINWWLLMYIGGFLFSLGFFFNKFRILKQLFSHKPVIRNSEMKIVEVPNSKIACTFYHTIFLGADLSEKEREQILSHERVHVKQKHTIDLLFFEVLRVVFWFNPLIYIYQSRISALHEYLADSGVVKNGKKQEYFQQLLNSAFNTEDISFVNQFFNHSIIKKRIVMLQRSRSKTISKLKFLIILPLMLAMLTYVSCSKEEQMKKETRSEEILTIEVENIKTLTTEEKEIFSTAFSQVMEDKTHKTLLLTDGNKTMEFSVDPETGAQNAKIYDQVEKEILDVQNNSITGDIPFAVIDEVPVFPGCESLESNEDRKKCMSEKINSFVNEHFNSSLGKENGLTGINRVYVQFKINKEGAVEVMGVRAPHPALQNEAERVVNLLPTMTPGKQKGKEVGVLYSLPITFKVGE